MPEDDTCSESHNTQKTESSNRAIRNVAVIAHVDHGKTTLVDQLFRQSGMFRENQVVQERLMDSMDLERERGITIASKNGALRYRDVIVNIIDTPGHADFGGQVERVLQMADGALLLVDAQEGPMPQTYFVLKKALARHLPVILVVNKIDKPASRPRWVVDQVFDLLVKLDAPSAILDFHALFASAIAGYAAEDPDVRTGDMRPLFDAILRYIPPPAGDAAAAFQMQVASIDHSPFLGRLGIGKVTGGRIAPGAAMALVNPAGKNLPVRITKLYRFECNRKVETDGAGPGDIIAVAGSEQVAVGDTYADPVAPRPLPTPRIDPPTISMLFIPNNSPFAGREGVFVTSTHLAQRLERERLSDVALTVEELEGRPGYKVAGRGELHLAILIEKMRREGYEFQVSCPEVILREIDGRLCEPYEDLVVEMGEQFCGTVMEKLGMRKGRLLDMQRDRDMARLRYKIPTRGLLGFKSEFLSDVKGMGTLTYVFLEYDVFAGELRRRRNGALVSTITGASVAYALFNLQRRGRLFLGPGVDVYRGQIIGEHSRENDLGVNPAKGKQLTNVRASGSDENIILTAPTAMSLEDCITFINPDELVEVTPRHIRLRKVPEYRIR